MMSSVSVCLGGLEYCQLGYGILLYGLEAGLIVMGQAGLAFFPAASSVAIDAQLVRFGVPPTGSLCKY
jgi:hypothetical protein